MDFTTTREPEGAIKTSTPGYSGQSPVGAGGDFGAVIGDILRQRRARRAPQQSFGAAPMAAAPRHANPAPSYSPSMGNAPMQQAQKARVTRMRKLQGTQDPNAVSAWAGSKALNPGTMVEEYQLPDGSWSLDAVYGTLEGNEAAARAHQQNVYQIGGGAGTSAAMDPRMIALRYQQRAAQDDLTPVTTNNKGQVVGGRK